MRHRKHNHQLGVKSAHRVSLIANLSCSLIEHGRIKTTLAKARALRPAIEKVITLAKKAHNCEDAARKIHYRRVAIAKLRNKKAVSKLFDELVSQFLGRNGGYTRIYKLALPRLGDAADMALIEFVEEAANKKTKKKKSSAKKKKDTAEVDKKKSDNVPAENASIDSEPVSEVQESQADNAEKSLSEVGTEEALEVTNESEVEESTSPESK